MWFTTRPSIMNALALLAFLCIAPSPIAASPQTQKVKRDTAALFPTWNLKYDSSGNRLVDVLTSDTNIYWPTISYDDYPWTNGIFMYSTCAGALIKTWSDSDAPPDNTYPAYGVTSAWCFKDYYTTNQPLTNISLSTSVTFSIYNSNTPSSFSENIVALELLTFRDYEVAVVRFEKSALELYNEGLSFSNISRMEDHPKPALVSTFTFRWDLSFRYLRISQGQFKGTMGCSWDQLFLYTSKNYSFYYNNKYCVEANTNFNASGSPTYDYLTGNLLYLADEMRIWGNAGTRVDWLRTCFESGVWNFSRWQCLPEWKIHMYNQYATELPGYSDAMTNYVAPTTTYAYDESINYETTTSTSSATTSSTTQSSSTATQSSTSAGAAAVNRDGQSLNWLITGSSVAVAFVSLLLGL